jgi:hypothetical protein
VATLVPEKGRTVCHLVSAIPTRDSDHVPADSLFKWLTDKVMATLVPEKGRTVGHLVSAMPTRGSDHVLGDSVAVSAVFSCRL